MKGPGCTSACTKTWSKHFWNLIIYLFVFEGLNSLTPPEVTQETSTTAVSNNAAIAPSFTTTPESPAENSQSDFMSMTIDQILKQLQTFEKNKTIQKSSSENVVKSKMSFSSHAVKEVKPSSNSAPAVLPAAPAVPMAVLHSIIMPSERCFKWYVDRSDSFYFVLSLIIFTGKHNQRCV